MSIFKQSLKLATLPLLLIGCKALESQNPRDSFVSGKLPKQLEWMRSQVREIPVKDREAIIERIAQDQKRTDLVRVAVIDSGVDLAQQDIRNQIEFRIQDGKIVGAGVDLMGGSAFASHVLVNPTLFAFSDDPLIDGKINKHVESPLALIKEIDARFVQLVLEGIANDPVLKNSDFNKLTSKNFTIAAFEYNIRENPTQRLRPSDKDHIASRGKIFQEFFKQDWQFNHKKQGPEQLTYMEYIEGYDQFKNILYKAIDTIEAEYSFSKRFENLIAFAEGKASVESGILSFPDAFKEAILFAKYGYEQYDPIAKLENVFKTHPRYSSLSLEQAAKLYFADSKSEIAEFLKRPNLPQDKRARLKKAEASLAKTELIFERLTAIKNNPAEYQELRSKLRREAIRNLHPYLSKESMENEHGTHVSGIIAKQNKNIRIFPIRATTQSMKVSAERQKELTQNIMERFREFKNTPYYKPLLQVISKEQGAIFAESTIEREIEKILSKKALNTVFINDIFAAIEATGRNNIKLANVSLGTSFEKDHTTNDKKAAIANDLLAELVRYEMGKEIQTKAPNTLFVVATGNDGKWIDGISRTSFPVGVTSTRLAKISEDLKIPETPNNSLRNVLAVASVNPKGTLTQFTNILIDPRTPQIYSTGEEIMSTIPGKNSSAADRLASPVYIDTMSTLLNLSILRGRDEMLKPPTEDPSIFASDRNATALHEGFQAEFSKSMTMLVKLAGKNDRAPMSGTSMATPTVTGVLANYIAKVMAEEKISTGQVYNHPRLAPDRLVKDLFALAKTNQLTDFITLKMIIDGVEKWKPAKGLDQQKKYLKYLQAPICSNIFR